MRDKRRIKFAFTQILCHNGSNDFTNHEEDSIRQSLFGRINGGLVTITAELCQDLLSFCLSAVFHNNAHHLRFYNLHESVWTTEILSCEKQFHLSTQFAIFLGFLLHFYPIWNIILYWLSAPCTNNCYVATIAWINTYWEVLKTKCKICVTQGKKRNAHVSVCWAADIFERRSDLPYLSVSPYSYCSQ